MTIKNLAFFGVMASILATGATHAVEPATRIATVGYVDGKINNGEINSTAAAAATGQTTAPTVKAVYDAIDAVSDQVANLDIPAAQVNSDWDATSGVAQILNKPTLATVATSGSYTDLSNKPTIPADTGDLTNNAGFITAAQVPAQVQSNWNESDSTAASYIANKPTLATVATSGSYTDLDDKPTIPTVDQTYGASSTNAQSGTAVAQAVAGAVSTINSTIGTVPENSTVMAEIQSAAASGNVQSDWDAVSGDAVILNKPTLATVATSGSYNDLSNKPTIPADTGDLTNNAGYLTAATLTLPNGTTSADGTGTKPVIAVTETAGVVNVQKGTITYDDAMDYQLPHFDAPSAQNIAWASGNCTRGAPCVLTFDGSDYVWTTMEIPSGN